MTASVIAEFLGICRQHIYEIESGHCPLTMDRLEQFANLYKVSAVSILMGERKSA